MVQSEKSRRYSPLNPTYGVHDCTVHVLKGILEDPTFQCRVSCGPRGSLQGVLPLRQRCPKAFDSSSKWCSTLEELLKTATKNLYPLSCFERQFDELCNEVVSI